MIKLWMLSKRFFSCSNSFSSTISFFGSDFVVYSMLTALFLFALLNNAKADIHGKRSEQRRSKGKGPVRFCTHRFIGFVKKFIGKTKIWLKSEQRKCHNQEECIRKRRQGIPPIFQLNFFAVKTLQQSASNGLFMWFFAFGAFFLSLSNFTPYKLHTHTQHPHFIAQCQRTS